MSATSLIRRWSIIMLFLLLVSAVVAYPMQLDGIEVPKDKCILYLFVGHSNMTGCVGIPDTVCHPRVWMYNATKGFWNARDPIESKYNAPSPVMPFLKKMAEYYPDYYFCGIKVTLAGMPMCDYYQRDKPKYTEIMALIDSVRDSVTFGGVLAMFGFIEGGSDTLSQKFGQDMLLMISQMRQDLQVQDLPLLMGRYEEKCDTTKYPQFNKHRQLILSTIEQLQTKDTPYHHIMVTPFYAVPREMYADDHHYSEKGYELWSHCAAEILFKSSWNSWCTNKIKPLQMLYPRGGEIFRSDERLPISWMSDPDSLSALYIQASADSGKNWEVISGDKNLQPWIRTFFWDPEKYVYSHPGAKQIMVAVRDYINAQCCCKSGLFSFDPTNPSIVREDYAVERGPGQVYKKGEYLYLDRQTSLQSSLLVFIYTLRGEKVYAGDLTNNRGMIPIPVSFLGQGTYLIMVRDRHRKSTLFCSPVTLTR